MNGTGVSGSSSPKAARHKSRAALVVSTAGKLPYRREGDRIYGPGIYDMKGGLVLAVAAFRRIAQARRRTPLPITFLFTPDEELSSLATRSVIEREAAGHRYVLVTEPARDGGKIADASPSGYSKGEGQKPVSKAYKDNWNAIFAKKKKR